MPNAITAIFGANSAQYQAELIKMQTMAAVAGRRIASAASGGVGGHGVHGMTGIIRETTVIGREIAMGRGIGRILGSMTLLVQYLSSASRAAHQTASAARILADGWDLAATKAEIAAVAAMRKAEASAVEAEMDGFENDASIAAATANAEEAVSAQNAARALRSKAAAADLDAVAQETDAAATDGAGISAIALVGIFALVAVAADFLYEHLRGVKAIISDFELGAGDINTEYIPLLKRHISDAANAQDEVTAAVNKTVDAYNSAAEAAKRQADATKEHYAHQKKMLELQKETELAGAKTNKEKEDIEAKYSGKELDLNQQEQKTVLADKLTEQANLQLESQDKLNKASAIHVNTKEEDERNMAQLKEKAENAKKLLEESALSREVAKKNERYAGGAKGEDIDNATIEAQKQAQQAINLAAHYGDKIAANDALRKHKDELVKGAAESAAGAAKAGLEASDMAKRNPLLNADAAAEAAARLATEKARDITKEPGGRSSGYGLNAQQRIGAYAATPVAMQQLNELKEIKNNTKQPKANNNRPPGTRPPHLGGTVDRGTYGNHQD